MGRVKPIALLLASMSASTPEGPDQDLEISVPVLGNTNSLEGLE